MSLNSKRIAFLGLLAAFSTVLVIIGSVIESSTLFFLSAASFSVGIAIREFGLRWGFGYMAASLFLSLLTSPNKIYCVTYGGLVLYILAAESAFDFLGRHDWGRKRKLLLWIFKYAIFNLMFLPALLLLPGLIYSGEITVWVFIGLMAGGQVVLFLYDYSYRYFQSQLWSKWRSRIL